MQSYYMYIDEKITIWQRNRYIVEANNPLEAKIKLVDYLTTNYDQDASIIQQDVEDLVDTSNQLIPEENYNEPTIEMYIADTPNQDIMFWDNVEKQIK
jgi:hypothetical protein